MQLTLPSYAARSHCRAIGNRSETARVFGNQHVIDWRPRKNCRDLCSRAGLARQVLCAMDCDIHLAGEKRSLDFRREQAFSTSIEVDNFGVIAACDDDFSLDCDVRMRASNCLLNQQSLCARKLAAACPEGDLAQSSRECNARYFAGEAVSLPYSSEARSGFSPREECSVACERRFNPREIESKNSVT